MELGIVLSLASPYTVALIIPLMMWFAFKNKYRVYMTPYNLCILGLFIWAGISGIRNRSWFSLFASGGFFVYFFVNVFFQNYFEEPEKMTQFLKKLHKYALITAFFGIAEKAVSLFVDMTWVSRLFWSPTYIPSKTMYRIYSTFGNPNVAGDWFALLTLISVYYLERASNAKKSFYLFSTFLFSAAMLFTGSKGSIMGFAAGLVVLALFSEKKKTKWVVGFMIISVFALSMFMPELNRPSNYRNALWLKSLMLYKHHPLYGVGMLGIFERTGEIHSHNIWISVLSMLGIVGFGLYLGMKLYIVNALIKLREVKNAFMPLMAGIQALISAHGLVDFTVMSPQGGILFFGAAGLVCALMTPHEKYAYVALDMRRVLDVLTTETHFNLYQRTEQRHKN